MTSTGSPPLLHELPGRVAASTKRCRSHRRRLERRRRHRERRAARLLDAIEAHAGRYHESGCTRCCPAAPSLHRRHGQGLATCRGSPPASRDAFHAGACDPVPNSFSEVPRSSRRHSWWPRSATRSAWLPLGVTPSTRRRSSASCLLRRGQPAHAAYVGEAAREPAPPGVRGRYTHGRASAARVARHRPPHRGARRAHPRRGDAQVGIGGGPQRRPRPARRSS